MEFKFIDAGDGWSIANDTCSDSPLAPSATCTFDVHFTAPAGCSLATGPHTFISLTTTPVVDGGFVNMVVTANCPGNP
ncbi:MAG TPA: hypothetical protein VKB43_12555 [Gaiellaceae bacterium]|nr:hypothetical protein [Gaiellaceae bacterium]